jgi:hypothetical protein
VPPTAEVRPFAVAIAARAQPYVNSQKWRASGDVLPAACDWLTAVARRCTRPFREPD